MSYKSWFAVSTVALLAVFFLLSIATPTRAHDGGFVPGELLVQFKAGTHENVSNQILQTHGAEAAGEIGPIRIKRLRVPEQAREQVKAALGKNFHVSFVEDNFVGEGGTTQPNDVKFPSQWHLPRIQADLAWDITTGAGALPIAIIDSGVDPAHPDLAAKLVPGYNFLCGNTDTSDVLGHGTAVAGTAAAISNNLTGVAGLAWNNPIMPLVVLDASDYASYYNIAQAITYAADHNVRVINISIGGSANSSTLQNAVDYAWNKGALVFACAHNYSTSLPYYPAACTHAVSVAATDSSDKPATFSNYGDWIDLSAPGTSIGA